MADNSAASAAYERFKLMWMLDHGFTLEDLVRELESLRAESPDLSIEALFHDWELECGFSSEIWPCFEEFLACEYLEMEVNEDEYQ